MSEIGWVIDTTDATFSVDVFERSKQGLVVVDFWAEWCAPCRTLGPILEKLAEEYAGKFTLVKANTENNQEAAGKFNVSGIPAVFAVDDGSVIDSFQGAMPEPAIRSWLDKLLSLGSITSALRLVQTDPLAAELQLRALLEQTPTDVEAQIALADALLQQSRLDECRAVIEQLEERGFLESSAEKVKAALALKSKSGGDLEKLRAAAAEDSKDFAAQLALAEALAGEQAYIESFEICLDLVMRDRKRTGEKARELMVEVFRVLPDDSPLTSEYRRKLSSALY